MKTPKNKLMNTNSTAANNKNIHFYGYTTILPYRDQNYPVQQWKTVVVVDVTTLKMTRKPVKIQRKVQQDALGKVNRIKEISIRE